jgi:hypothetical protein
MTPELILVVAALICVVGVVAAVYIAIKYRDEDWAFVPIMAAFMLGCAAGGCISEAVKRSDDRERRESGVPVDARPAK